MNAPRMAATATLVLVGLSSCTTVHYMSPRFIETSAAHQTIAVLPFEMVLTVKNPDEISLDRIAAIEEGESLAFQAAYFDRLLNEASANKKKRIRVTLQQPEVTNRLLLEHGIGIRESWALPAQTLAGMLGVDAVVRTTVWKSHLLSDAASFGIEVGTHVLSELLDHPGPVVPFGLTKTADVYADSQLLNGEDGLLLWKVGIHRDTDWRRPANDVVVGIAGKLAKKFPYRDSGI